MAETFLWLGLPARDLFEQANIPFRTLENSSNRYPQDNVTQLWQLAEQASKDANIGLKAGNNLSISTIPVVGFALLECQNAEAAMELLIRYQKAIGDTSNVKLLTSSSSQARLLFELNADGRPLSRHSYEAAMAFSIKLARTISGHDWAPLQVQLMSAQPDEQTAQLHRTIFHCEVLYNQANYSLMFAREINTRQTRAYLHQAQNSDHRPLTRLIQLMLEESLPSGEVKREFFAKRLHISEKTLQRKLQGEGSCFTDLVDEVRKARSAALLTASHLSITEIAFLCGFSELSAFHHAFKRWFQQTPGQYRQQNANRAD